MYNNEMNNLLIEMPSNTLSEVNIHCDNNNNLCYEAPSIPKIHCTASLTEACDIEQSNVLNRWQCTNSQSHICNEYIYPNDDTVTLTEYASASYEMRGVSNTNYNSFYKDILNYTRQIETYLDKVWTTHNADGNLRIAANEIDSEIELYNGMQVSDFTADCRSSCDIEIYSKLFCDDDVCRLLQRFDKIKFEQMMRQNMQTLFGSISNDFDFLVFNVSYPPIPPSQESANDPDDSSSSNVIIIVVCLVIAFLLICVGVILCYFYKKRQSVDRETNMMTAQSGSINSVALPEVTVKDMHYYIENTAKYEWKKGKKTEEKVQNTEEKSEQEEEERGPEGTMNGVRNSDILTMYFESKPKAKFKATLDAPTIKDPDYKNTHKRRQLLVIRDGENNDNILYIFVGDENEKKNAIKKVSEYVRMDNSFDIEVVRTVDDGTEVDNLHICAGDDGILAQRYYNLLSRIAPVTKNARGNNDPLQIEFGKREISHFSDNDKDVIATLDVPYYLVLRKYAETGDDRPVICRIRRNDIVDVETDDDEDGYAIIVTFKTSNDETDTLKISDMNSKMCKSYMMILHKFRNDKLPEMAKICYCSEKEEFNARLDFDEKGNWLLFVDNEGKELRRIDTEKIVCFGKVTKDTNESEIYRFWIDFVVDDKWDRCYVDGIEENDARCYNQLMEDFCEMKPVNNYGVMHLVTKYNQGKNVQKEYECSITIWDTLMIHEFENDEALYKRKEIGINIGKDKIENFSKIHKDEEEKSEAKCSFWIDILGETEFDHERLHFSKVKEVGAKAYLERMKKFMVDVAPVDYNTETGW